MLHLFDNQADARNGRLAPSKYGRICFVGQDGDDLDVVSFML